MNLKITLNNVLVLLGVFLFSWSTHGQNSKGCPANDFNLTTFYLGDASGAPFSNGSCTPGSPVNTHIWVQFTPTAASDRYSLHLTFNVKITKPDGSVQSYAVNDCLYEGQPIPTHGLLDIHTFTWNCGDEVELSNFYMAWQSNSGKDCDVNPSKCYSELGPFIIDAPLVANYTYAVDCSNDYTIDFSTFVTGGKRNSSSGTPINSPYSYTWNWGDGTTTGPTSLSPPVSSFSHTFPSAGTYNVTLTATDTSNPVSSDSQMYTIVVNDPLFLSTNTVTDIECSGSPDGYIDLSVSGGTFPYTYSWTSNNGFSATTEDVSNLLPGTYNVIVTDKNGCTATISKEFLVTDTEDPTIQVPSPLNLEGCDTSAITAESIARFAFSTTDVNITSSFDNGIDYLAHDDGTIQSITYIDVVSGGTTCPIVVTRTFTIKDNCGKEVSTTQTINIQQGDFTLPENDGSTISCASEAVAPTLPVVLDACNVAIVPSGPVVSATPDCEGTISYTYTYEDCAGHKHDWVYTYTIDYQDFTMPSNDGSTVACLDDITEPVPPTVYDNCGKEIIPTGPIVGSDPACEGTKTYTWNYADCSGFNHDWVYTYTIDYQDFTMPSNDGSTVACLDDITEPVPPTVYDNCGKEIIPTGPIVGSDPACEGTKTYTWNYADCSGFNHDWVYTYTIDYQDFTMPSNDGSTVACLDDITEPVPPTVYDNCGKEIIPTGPIVGSDPACEGTKTYTWNYADCSGFNHDWVYTYTIDYQDFTMPSNDGSTVACLDDITEPVPPTVYDNCGKEIIPTGPIVGSDPACEGTKTYTWNYADCSGFNHDWVYTYTIDYQDFTMPSNDGSTVACLDDITEPVPPTVYDNCGKEIIPTGPIVGSDPACEGTKTYTWNYADCSGFNHDWVYTYTIDYQDFTMPSNDGSTVACLDDITEPVPPTVYDNCGKEIIPTGPIVGSDPACEGTKTYTWNYADCSGFNHDWVYTYTIDYQDFTMPSNDGSTVACLDDITEPVPPTVYDNCGKEIIPTGPIVGSDPACEGTKTYTWNYADCSGFNHDWVYTYTIDYQDFTMPSNDGSTVACLDDITEPVPPTVYDNCGKEIIPTGPIVGSDPACEGTKTYTWNYADCSGFNHDWVYTYTIDYQDFTMPSNDGSTVACLDDITEPVPPTVYDNCGKEIIPTGPIVGSDPACEGTKTYTWNYADCSGFNHDWVYTYTIDYQDFTMPSNDGSTVACLDDITEPVPPTVYDNCGKEIIPTGPIVGSDPACEGTKTYTWNYADCSGFNHDWVYTYTIDYQDFTMPSNDGSTVACLSEITQPTPPTVTDNCGNEIIPTGPVVSEDPTCAGTKTYTWNYADCTGTNHDWVYTYTLNDNVKPTLTSVASNLVVECDGSGNNQEIQEWLNNNGGASAMDNCSEVIWSNNYGQVASDCAEPITVTFTATDACGNFVETTATYAIKDTTKPIITNAQSTTVECDGQGNVQALQDWLANNGGATATDDCGAITWSNNANQVAFEEACGSTGSYTVTFRATDSCDNFVETTATFTIEDTTAPTISVVAQNKTVECDGQGNEQAFQEWLANNGGASVTADNCSTVSWSNNANQVAFEEACGSTGSYTVTFRATDSCDNFVETTATFTIEDTTAPTISVVAQNKTVECDGLGNTEAFQEWLANNGGASVTADNCSTVSWSNNANQVAFEEACGSTGSYTVTFRATDSCDNFVETTATFTIEDTTAPTISVVAQNKTVECDGLGNTEAFQEWLANNGGASVTADNCSTVSWSNNANQVAFEEACGSTGSYTVTFRATDSCDNFVETTATFTIEDTTAPTISVVAQNKTVECDGQGNEQAFQEWLANNGGASVTADNCSTVSWSNNANQVAFEEACGSTGSYTVTFRATDSCDNFVETTATFTIEDTTAPTISVVAQNKTVECDGQGNEQAFQEWLANNGGASVTADNCSTVSWSNNANQVAFEEACGSTGSYTVTFRATDSCDNFAETTATFTIEDTTAPTISVVAQNKTVECDGQGNEQAFQEWLANNGGASVTADNCSTVSWSNNANQVAFEEACGSTGSYTVTFRATDSCDNFVETTATFTIEDTTAPTFTAPENIEIFIDAECSYDTSVAVTGDVEDENDGCSTDLNATFEDTIIPGCGSSFTIERTWTLADNCGNQAEPQVQIIKVTDNIPPIIDKTGLRNLVVECGTDYLADLNEWLNNNAGAVAIDNCDDVTWTHNFEGLEEGCSNDIIVRFTATDECGNQAETKATFTIKDTQAPTITLQPEDKTVECDGQGNTEAFEEWLNSNGGATATDECSVFNWSNDYSEQSWVSECETVKYAEVTFTASDACNNVAMTQKVRFTIEDTTAPVFVEELPGDLTVECNEVPEAAVLTVTEQCDSSITVDFNEEITYDTEVCSTNYTIVRTWTATDCAGNIATHTQNIRVEDTTAPVFTAQELPGNLTVECDDVPEAITLTATDNCSGETEVTFTEEITDTSETCGSSYVITRTWTTSDCAGNTTTHVQTITVRDITAPIMLTELDEEITVSCSEIPAVPTVIFNDNCTGSEELVVTFNETSTRTDEISDYNIIRTWKATDLCGNETEFTQTIKVQLNDQVTPYELDICIEDAEINLFSLLAQGYEQGGVWETPANFNLRDGSWLDPANIALGEYTFYYTVTDSDCPSRTQVNVKINDDCVVLACTADDIIISKVVTPNGDGQNDFFTIEGIDPECGFTFDVKLFNRWGDFIFESNNYQNNWNGQAPSGAIGAAGKIPTGTYFYIINVRNSGIKPITGYIYFATK